ncbi:hypothetical protein PAXRUDRAFT_825441 [Paxillus rubicundulus Ve08.2h10]|uniref:Uncharacterized protein n=1 Tax=Paxillus rubicundulus Ve08.2h10 TaxID=930991 RepID=A0A0D0E692_9AGAM|nr:hypothetical protein PAXRUDRAFT_825441 [Paxillus rubicundulus Ve08.2h10]
MPRLLPRLLKMLKEAPLTDHHPRHVDRSQNVSSSKRKSLYHLPTPPPSFNPAGRSHSILLNENPVTDKQVFTRHKSLPPTVRVAPTHVAHERYDAPREMTVEEREWWSSPYLRMLSTPLRQCAVSRRYLPTDFLVRLAPLRLPIPRGSRSVQVLMPDGIEHPKFKRRQAHTAVYASCWKHAFQNIGERVSVPRQAPNLVFSKHLCTHISYLLRLRILQELDVLINALKLNPFPRPELNATPDATILRRLRRSEFKAFRETAQLPHPGAVAVLVVPPLNSDSKTREPDFPFAELSDPPATVHKKPLPPLSTLHNVIASRNAGEEVNDIAEISLSTFLPSARVPLYNGIAMFPSPPHRAALYNALCKLLDRERHFRGMCSASDKGHGEFKHAKGDKKGSHAFLLTSNVQTVRRADTVPLAIALWRLRMWEGDAFTGEGEGWEIGNEWRIEYAKCLP